MNIALQTSDRIESRTTRRDSARWSSICGWLLAAVLACASSVALALGDLPRGEVREWIEFKAAPGIGLPRGAWLRAPEHGYADIHHRSGRSPAIDDGSELNSTLTQSPSGIPPESTYVDLGRAARR